MWNKLPKLVRFMLYHALWGMVMGAITTFALIWTNFMDVGRLISGSGLATFILFFQMSMTFGAIALGVAVMNLGGDDET